MTTRFGGRGIPVVLKSIPSWMSSFNKVSCPLVNDLLSQGTLAFYSSHYHHLSLRSFQLNRGENKRKKAEILRKCVISLVWLSSWWGDYGQYIGQGTSPLWEEWPSGWRGRPCLKNLTPLQQGGSDILYFEVMTSPLMRPFINRECFLLDETRQR